jgi:hypothetical protein
VSDTGALTSTQGHLLTYDLDGNRISDTSMGRVVSSNVQASVNVDKSCTNESGNPVTVTYTTTYGFEPGASTYHYHYDVRVRLRGVVDEASVRCVLRTRREPGAPTAPN